MTQGRAGSRFPLRQPHTRAGLARFAGKYLLPAFAFERCFCVLHKAAEIKRPHRCLDAAPINNCLMHRRKSRKKRTCSARGSSKSRGAESFRRTFSDRSRDTVASSHPMQRMGPPTRLDTRLLVVASDAWSRMGRRVTTSHNLRANCQTCGKLRAAARP
jgi:hypothetical protein